MIRGILNILRTHNKAFSCRVLNFNLLCQGQLQQQIRNMPVVSVGRDKLFEKLGQTYTEEEFEDLCFDYGIELDDVTSEREMLRKEWAKEKEEAGLEDASEEILYKIDIPANRYDMLCLEGIANALNIFRGKTKVPNYRVKQIQEQDMLQMRVQAQTALIRPFVVCAVLRGITFDKTNYNSFIELQDKLHQNLCRQRTLVAIGTHDLDTIKAPFTYEAKPPQEISFTPLKQTMEFKADELMEFYMQNDMKLKKYAPIIKDSAVYPVIYDSQGIVLSLPPVINGSHSAIKLETKNVFIECTATDLTKAKIVLNTVCCMFGEYCSEPFEIEPVQVIDPSGKSTIYPEMHSRDMEVEVDYINSLIGTQIQREDLVNLLSKMQLECNLIDDTQRLKIRVPPTRSDILHACDVAEDVAIAHNYNNIAKTVPSTYTQGMELPLNQLTELLRLECAMAGYTEVLTWALCSHAENFQFLRKQDNGNVAVAIGNPATAEFEVCRTSLLPGMLKTLSANKDAPLPLKLFEVSDAIVLNDNIEVGAQNRRHLVAAYSGKDSGFEHIHGLLNRLMNVLGVPMENDEISNEDNSKLREKFGGGYMWQSCQDDTFLQGRSAKVFCKGQEVGCYGIVHPEVLARFDIAYPVSVLELYIEPFCFDQKYQSLLVQI
eukprot:TRINITY_DN12135_c0_g1_i1.p1 TRINITY_DN12135_c0_g1~~TRINITY_DN12135_c0_g1_i1.p1  ORF type:complete len:659 (-),score=55.76 TRINITY_DN12135_c0_g1_i1:513-2489(-)